MGFTDDVPDPEYSEGACSRVNHIPGPSPPSTRGRRESNCLSPLPITLYQLPAQREPPVQVATTTVVLRRRAPRAWGEQFSKLF